MKFFLSICSLAKNASKSQKIEKYHVCFVQSSPPPTHSHHNQRMNKLEQNERTKISNPKSKTCFQTYIFDTFKAGNFYVHKIFCNELTNEFLAKKHASESFALHYIEINFKTNLKTLNSAPNASEDIHFFWVREKWKYRKTSCQTKKEPHLEHEKIPSVKSY